MRGRALTTVTTTVVLTIAATACGPARSTEAYCATMEKHKERYLSAFEDANANLESGDGAAALVGSAQAVAAIGDLRTMWRELADVAPSEIQGDVEQIRDVTDDQFERAKEALDDPLGAMAGNLLDGVMSAGSYQRVDTFTRENCDS